MEGGEGGHLVVNSNWTRSQVDHPGGGSFTLDSIRQDLSCRDKTIITGYQAAILPANLATRLHPSLTTPIRIV